VGIEDEASRLAAARDLAVIRKFARAISSVRGDAEPNVHWRVGRAAWELGVTIREYRELEAGTRWPSSETWDRMCELYGWPQASWGARRLRLDQRWCHRPNR
jgi:hypothetical protein